MEGWTFRWGGEKDRKILTLATEHAHYSSIKSTHVNHYTTLSLFLGELFPHSFPLFFPHTFSIGSKRQLRVPFWNCRSTYSERLYRTPPFTKTSRLSLIFTSTSSVSPTGLSGMAFKLDPRSRRLACDREVSRTGGSLGRFLCSRRSFGRFIIAIASVSGFMGKTGGGNGQEWESGLALSSEAVACPVTFFCAAVRPAVHSFSPL